MQDLLRDLRDRLSGDFESVTAGLLMTPDEYDAYLIYKAIEVCLNISLRITGDCLHLGNTAIF